MVKQTEIVDALQTRLHKKWPDTSIMENLVRIGFERPSLYLNVHPPEIIDAAYTLLKIQQRIDIVAFPPVDGESLNSSLRELLTWQQSIIELFSTGFLPVGDRALHLTAQAGELDSDAATVLLQLDYYDDRPPVGREYDAMGDLQIAVNEEV